MYSPSRAVAKLDRNLVRVKAVIFSLILLLSLLFLPRGSAAFLTYGVLIVLVSYNLALSHYMQKPLPRPLSSVLMVADILLVFFLVSQGHRYESYFSHLYLLPIVTYALRTGLEGGLTTALLSVVAIAARQALSGGLGQLFAHPEQWVVPGTVFLTAGWFVGKLVENDFELRKAWEDLVHFTRLDESTGAFNYQYFSRCLEEEIEECREPGDYVSVILLSLDDFKEHDLEAQMRMVSQAANTIQEYVRGRDRVCRVGEDMFAVIMAGSDSLDALDVAERIRSSIRRSAIRTSGEAVRFTVSISIATYPKDAATAENLIYRAEQTLFRARHQRKDRVCLSSVTIEEVQAKINRAGSALAKNIPTLVAIIDAKDVNTCGHSERVTKYSVAIARWLGLPEDQIEDLKFGALLHDIGKVSLEEYLLDKPGRLSQEELDCIRNHPIFGATFVETIDYLKKVSPIVLYHHERLDGSGYPYGLKGEEIPLAARIVAVADAFDAMTSVRPYKGPKSPEEALAELRRLSGQQFDPAAVDALCAVFPSLEAGDEAAAAAD
ncbi:MAG: diguanylate cyclase [Bacillota bacterium]|nr:diguanylate cyclase [Bacillota bacterium]